MTLSIDSHVKIISNKTCNYMHVLSQYYFFEIPVDIFVRTHILFKLKTGITYPSPPSKTKPKKQHVHTHRVF